MGRLQRRKSGGDGGWVVHTEWAISREGGLVKEGLTLIGAPPLAAWASPGYNYFEISGPCRKYSKYFPQL